MSTSDLKLILRLYTQPGAAMSDILDRGSLLFASASVLVVSFGLKYLLADFPLPFYGPLFILAVIFTPGVLLIGGWVGRGAGSFRSSLQRDYAPMLTCTAVAWSAANLPLLVITWIRPELFPAASGAAYAYFAVLLFFAIRTIFGTGNGPAVVIVGLSWIPLAAAYLLRGPLQYLLGWLTSPFLLFYAFYYLRGEFSNLGAGLRRGQSFRRNLEAAAINPHDAEAQYQLGLIYQQRRQFTEAIQRFQNAVRIDPTETDAHFQLGRIAREQGRLNDALGHFQTVVNLDERHSQGEILRELGALYISAHQYGHAHDELLKYEERRPYDAEGLYYHGQALEGLGKPEEARGLYRRAVEAASLAPHYLRRAAGKWGRLALKNTRKQESKLR